MDVKQFSISALVGAVVLFLLGFLVYGILLTGFMEANTGSATGVMKSDEEMSMPLLFVGQLCTACLITYVYLRWASISTFKTGLLAGLVIGLLMAFGYNLVSFATSNLTTFSFAVIDAVIYGVMIGITGGVIGLVLGRLKK